jgi:hypothetical protein
MYEENKQHLELGEIGRERRTWKERERERARFLIKTRELEKTC